MTTVNNNTFTGPNAGIVGGYVPLTTIESTSMDGDLDLVKDDLDYHLSILQAIYTKLDTIEAGATATPSASTMVSTINASAELIDADNLESTVALLSNIISDIEAHRVTTTQSAMHPEDSIKSTDQTYSYTPSSIVTSCQNVLDEINNIRAQIHKILGQSTWIDTPNATIAEIKTKLDTIETNATSDMTNTEVKTAYETNSNTNAFTDAEQTKLSNIENNANYYISDDDLSLNLVTKTANYTAQLSDYTILCNTTSGTITITLPTAIGNSGRIYNISKRDSTTNNVIINGNGSETINDQLIYTISIQYANITLQSDGAGWVIL